MRPNFKVVKYDLKAEDYISLIPGEASELLSCVESYRTSYPKTAEYFGSILQAHHERHPHLEDWLIITHYQFFWDGDYRALQQIENLFYESIRSIGIASWKNRIEKSILRTNYAKTQDLFDRLYDIQLELYGALYLTRQGWSVNFIHRSNNEKKPDIRGVQNTQECVLECKFVHSSDKYPSFSYRFNIAVSKYSQPRPPLVFRKQFSFPFSSEIKSLTSTNHSLVNAFNRKIFQDHESTQIAVFEGGAFVYSYWLHPALVPINALYEFAKNQGLEFACKYLKRLPDKASLQINKPEYTNCQKFLFIALQPDVLYLSSWNEPAISHVKFIIAPIAIEEGIVLVFKENADFILRGYSQLKKQS